MIKEQNMPWQGHLWIGEPVHNYEEVREALLRAGASKDELPEQDDELYEVNVVIDDKIKHLPCVPDDNDEYFVEFLHEGESGCPFPPQDKYEQQSPFALVGFPITMRYKGEILDREFVEGGRPDPFVINLDEVHQLLEAVHKFWPQAQLLLMDNFF
jgi:hypothetical protein